MGRFDDTVDVEFDVSDSGIGMTDESLSRLFEPFHQVDGSRSRRQGGTGLGLAISARIMEAMGSKIEVSSRMGAGSSFRFRLSLAVDSSPTHAPPVDSSMGSLDGMSGLSGRVLVVEDNEVNRMIAKQILQSLGMQVIEAANGEEAIDVLRRESVDIVLMDCQMPVLDGYAATREIRRLEAKAGLTRVPILALTADAFDDDAHRARESRNGRTHGQALRPGTTHKNMLQRWL